MRLATTCERSASASPPPHIATTRGVWTNSLVTSLIWRFSDFEPPIGTERLEEFLDRQWGERAGRTYNKNLSILRDFFKFHVLRGNLHGDPTLPIERAKKRAVLRENFSANTRNPPGFKPDLG